MLTALTNPSFDSDSRRADWIKSLQKAWNSLLGKFLHIDVPESTPEEEKLREYYDKVVSKMELAIRQDKRGKLHLEGLDASSVTKL